MVDRDPFLHHARPCVEIARIRFTDEVCVQFVVVHCFRPPLIWYMVFLTFEHIPPKKAYNWERAKIYNGYEALNKSQGEPARYSNSQQGMGKYSLCQSCNNNTGTWYAQAYCDFAMDVIKSLHKGDQPLKHGDIINYRFKDCPALQIVKQVIAMFCSLLPYHEVKRLGFDRLLLEQKSNTVDKE